MKKIHTLLRLVDTRQLTTRFSRLTFQGSDLGAVLRQVEPGQFAQVLIRCAGGPLLRRPISINEVDPERGTLTLLVRRAGVATDALCDFPEGSKVDMLLPLGNHFTIPADTQTKTLLVGGGVGVAPLLFLGTRLKDAGLMPTFLLGARTKEELLLLDRFELVGRTETSTDDGSCGHPGVVTLNPLLDQPWDKIYCCGPAPMMKGVAAKAKQRGVDCEVSLENMMACGLGACLCCVERTVKGNVCVCTEGPVFSTSQLTW